MKLLKIKNVSENLPVFIDKINTGRYTMINEVELIKHINSIKTFLVVILTIAIVFLICNVSILITGNFLIKNCLTLTTVNYFVLLLTLVLIIRVSFILFKHKEIENLTLDALKCEKVDKFSIYFKIITKIYLDAIYFKKHILKKDK